MEFLSATGDGGTLLRLYVQPRAAKTRVSGVYDGKLKLSIASPPIDGKANKEVIGFLAKTLGIAKKDLFLKTGANARYKVIAINCLSKEKVQTAIEPLLR